MGKMIEQLAGQSVGGAVDGAMGLLLGGINDRRQRRQQEKLQEIQIRGSKELTDYQYAKQLQMWKDTNYSTQKEQLEKAGLNPGLIYGMSGGGGTTTGSGSGSVTGATAPAGGREAQDLMGMGMQRELLQAQKENIEASTEKTKAESSKIAGVDTKLGETQIQDLTQGISNKKAQEELTKMQTRLATIESKIKGDTIEEAISMIDWQEQQMHTQLDIMVRNNIIDKITMNDKIDTIKAHMLGAFLQNELTKSQIGKSNSEIQLNQQQITNLSHKIVQEWRQMELNGINTNTQQAQQKLNQWTNDIQNSTKIPTDILEKALQAIILK